MAFSPTYLILSDAKIPAMCNVCMQNRAAKKERKTSTHSLSHFYTVSIAWHAPKGHIGMHSRTETAYRTVKERTLWFQSTEKIAELLLL